MQHIEQEAGARQIASGTALANPPGRITETELRVAVERFYQHLEEECDRCGEFLTPADAEQFRRYCARVRLSRNRPDQRLGALTAWCSRLVLLTNDLPSVQKHSVTVLDAGSGYGSEAIVLAHLGVGVTGIDLRADRVEVARKRAEYYAGLGYCIVQPEFVSRNIFTHLEGRPRAYNAIWSQASIEHIEPTARFLQLSLSALCAGGRIVISCVNRLNPIVNRRLTKKRGNTLYSERMDPETGTAVPYAVERVYSTFELGRMLRQAGFSEVDVRYHSYVPTSMREWLGHRQHLRIDRLARHTPLLRHFAGSYTVIGKKA